MEAEVLEKEEELQLKVEEHQRKEAERAQRMAELRAVASHWTEKWQDVALTLHSTQGKLEQLKQREPGNKVRLSHNLVTIVLPVVCVRYY